MDIINFPAILADNRQVDISQLNLDTDLMIVGKLIPTTRDGTQYRTLAMPIADLMAVAAGDWKKVGNVAAAADFIGTLNNQDFRIRVNNLEIAHFEVSSQALVMKSPNGTPEYILRKPGKQDVAMGRNGADWYVRQGGTYWIAIKGPTGFVGIGTTTPTEKLEVIGSIIMNDGNQAPNYVMASDAFGKATWTDLATILPAGVVTGTGTPGYLPIWTGAATMGDSPMLVTVSGIVMDFAGAPTTFSKGSIQMKDTNDNLFIGEDSGALSTVNAFANTSLGVYSLLSLTTGDNNVALGYQALYSNQVGDNNIAIGYGALFTATVSDNIAVGYNALKFNQTGIYNVSIGNYSLELHTSGNRNISIGHQSLAVDLTGANNISIGFQSMFRNINGPNNLSIGDLALTFNTSGGQNVALGPSALYSNGTGSYNTAVGYGALQTTSTTDRSTAIGGNSLELATGQRNTAAGYGAGGSITTGILNSFLGYDAGKNASQKVNATNSTAIGNGSYTTADNQIVLGNSSVLELLINGCITLAGKTIDTTAGDSATINAPSGRFRKDTSGSTFTLTNSYITANSIILLTLITAGITTGYQLSVQAGPGSAVITFETDGVGAAPSANCDVNFLVLN